MTLQLMKLLLVLNLVLCLPITTRAQSLQACSPSPDPPATRLLRPLLEDAVPPEPSINATQGDVAAWWDAVAQVVDDQRRGHAYASLNHVQRRVLETISDEARAASMKALPHLQQRFAVRAPSTLLCLTLLLCASNTLTDWTDVHIRMHSHFLLQDLGLSEMDMRVTLAWFLAAAPLIIHFNARRALGHLVADTHVRNQFE